MRIPVEPRTCPASKNSNVTASPSAFGARSPESVYACRNAHDCQRSAARSASRWVKSGYKVVPSSSRCRVITLTELCNNTLDRKSTRLNSSHQIISYAVFCLKKKKRQTIFKHNAAQQQ